MYLAGLILGDAPLPGRQTISVFHDGAAWVAQVGLFLFLGLLVSPDRLFAVAPQGVALGLVVVLIARPLATLVATVGQGFSLSERAVLSCAGLRGAAPVVFATFPVAGAIPGSRLLFNIIFFAVVISTLLQGLTFEPLARRLRVTTVSPVLPRPLVEFGGPRSLGAELVEYPVTSMDGVVGRRVGDLALPPGISVVVIVRGDQAVPPAGTTRMNAGDVVHLLVRSEIARWIPELLHGLRDPEAPEPGRPQPHGSDQDRALAPWLPADRPPIS